MLIDRIYTKDGKNVERLAPGQPRRSYFPGAKAFTRYGSRGLFYAGHAPPGFYNSIEYITIATPSDAAFFGEAVQAKHTQAGASDGSRGIFAGGNVNPAAPDGGATNVIEYLTISTPSDGIDFGDLTTNRNSLCGVSDDNGRAVFGGSGTNTDTMDYISIPTPSNAIDFGNLTEGRNSVGGCDSSTRGVFAGGQVPADSPSYKDTIDYITIATPMNALDFGDLIAGHKFKSGVSADNRGVFVGGEDPVTATMDYISIDTPGGAGDFGDMGTAGYGIGAVDDNSRGVFAGGSHAGTDIVYITIETTSGTSTFGDLRTARYATGSCSGG